ncbi:MAG: branched-chain amino acid ABC transporter permease [Halobacteriales archaeon]|nr:branched-chain amino acid ABC transporter permease [Halobacteriales archaeon]
MSAGVVLDPLFVDVFLEFLRPDNLASVLFDGLSKAALFIMIASGLTLIFGLMGVLNFAHGSLTMIGAYLGGLLLVVTVSEATGTLGRLGLFFVAVAVVFTVLTVAGSAMEVGLIRPLYDRNPLYQILLTFGLTLVLDELVEIVVLFYGIQPTTEWQAAMGTKPAVLTANYDLLGARVPGLDLFEIGFGVLTVAAVWAFLTRTRYGLYIRAGSEDPEMTEALGIDVHRAFTVVFGLGVGIAGVAGTLLAWDISWGASVPLAAETLLPAFVVVIVGGLGTFRGTVVAGILVGMVDATMTWWFQNAIDFPGLPELTIFLILVIGLILRPQGLFGVEGVGGH